jgi:prefoldin subunit 5
MEAEGLIDLVSVETGVPGLYVDLYPTEAIEYIKKKEILLQDRLNICNNNITQIQQHIEAITRSIPVFGNEVDINEPMT